jgi:hypothetical protein
LVPPTSTPIRLTRRPAALRGRESDQDTAARTLEQRSILGLRHRDPALRFLGYFEPERAHPIALTVR